MKVTVQDDVCQGHTLCAMAAPALFGLRDDDGHAYVLVTGDLAPDQEVAARRAAEGCPERAIVLED